MGRITVAPKWSITRPVGLHLLVLERSALRWPGLFWTAENMGAATLLNAKGNHDRP